MANADLVKDRMPTDRQGERATVSLSDQRQKEWNNWLLGEGPLPFTGERAVRANDRRRGDLTFLEGGKSATNNPSRFVGDATDGKKKPPTEFQASTQIKKRVFGIQIKR